jgi:transcription antitermination factor NusG
MALSEASGNYIVAPETIDMSEAREWFAIQTRYRFEKKVAAELEHKECEVYLPLLTEDHRWSDRQKEITIPLFAGYAFVHIDQSREARSRILQTAGVTGFVKFGGTMVVVPQKQIEDLELLLREKKPFSMHSFIRLGQRVRIRGGCLNGVEGVLTQNDKGRVLISIEAIQRSIAIEVRGYELELV